MEQQSFDANLVRSTAVSLLQRELQAWYEGRNEDDDYEKAGWISEVNDSLFRFLPGAQVAFMVREAGSDVETEELDIALFVPAYLTRFFVCQSVMRHPSVVIELGADGMLTTLKNRYGSQRVLESVQGSVVLSDPGMPPCIVRFTTVVPDGR